MKKWLLGIGLLIPLAALANNRDFEIYNDTASDIATVYFSTRDYNKWVPSGHSYISSGQHNTINFSNNDGPCEMQMKIHFTNGADAEWSRGFNFCTVSKITITGDPNGYRARWE